MRGHLAAALLVWGLGVWSTHVEAQDAVAQDAVAEAEPATPTPRGPRPDKPPHLGVMLRLTLGGAYVHGWSQAEGMSRTLSAFPAGTLSFALGHALTDALTLHMDLLATRSGGATYSSEGATIVDDVDLTAILLTLGGTYWITPDDFFVSAGLGLGQVSTVTGAFRITIEIPDIQSTRVGVGGYAAVGKQWRLSPRWGMGPLFQVSFLRAGQSVADPLKLIALNLALSITFD